MILFIRNMWYVERGIPRESGDDPTLGSSGRYRTMYSPRERG